MSVAMMNPAQQQLPHRKPVPAQRSFNNLQQQPQMQQAPYAGERRPYSGPGPESHANNATRTTSTHSMQSQQHPQQTRRTLSNATTSTTSTNAGLQRAPTNSTAPRRSTSSRSSSASPTSYVALMRKQKATVWCDRAQHEDPRILAAQRAAKMRAAMEVAGGAHHRISTSSSVPSQSVGIRSKIRHHGVAKATTYTGTGNLSGAAVPMRLSATEVDENDSDEENDSKYVNHPDRNGSGRSSLGSGRKGNNYLGPGLGYSNGSTPQSGHSPVGSMGDVLEEETPMPNEYSVHQGDYFQQTGGNGDSGDSAEAEQSFGKIGGLPKRMSKVEQDRKTSEELRRRGSVDDRSMTMTGRLFIANPDLSD